MKRKDIIKELKKEIANDREQVSRSTNDKSASFWRGCAIGEQFAIDLLVLSQVDE